MTFEDDEELASFTVSGDYSAGREISGTSYTYHSYPYLFNEGSYTITVTDVEGNDATGYIIIDQTEPVVSCGSNTIYDTDFVYFKSCTLSFLNNSSIKSTYIYKYKNTGANLELVSTNVNGYTFQKKDIIQSMLGILQIIVLLLILLLIQLLLYGTLKVMVVMV